MWESDPDLSHSPIFTTTCLLVTNTSTWTAHRVWTKPERHVFKTPQQDKLLMTVARLCLNLQAKKTKKKPQLLKIKHCILIMSLITIPPPPSPSPPSLFLPFRLYDATRVPLDTLALWRALMTPWQTAKNHLATPPTPPYQHHHQHHNNSTQTLVPQRQEATQAATAQHLMEAARYNNNTPKFIPMCRI